MSTPLPVALRREDILATIARHQVTVIAGETGSGKTTLIPLFLMEAGYCTRGIIGVTEPRRIAATSVADYVASRVDGIGGLVGYQIRHDKKVGPHTRIKYMTEGILLREFLDDPMLANYDVLVLDEVHERGVNQDLLMALIKRLCAKRPELKVVIMSATIDDAKYAKWFDAPIVCVEGRVHDVEIRYTASAMGDMESYICSSIVDTIDDTDGDTLVFVPDYATIRNVGEYLREFHTDRFTVHSLYGRQSPEEQREVFNRTGKCVILATNVAETSVTLDGVTMVIDTGLIKEMRYRPERRMSTLKVVNHSRAGSRQRSGRAGRTQPGVCLRLFSERDFEKRFEYTQPEILRSNLDSVLLQLIAMGFTYQNAYEIDWLSPPRFEDWKAARESLELLGALNTSAKITGLGRIMAELPLDPVISRMMLAAADHRCVDAVATIAASFSTRPVFLRPPGEEEIADEVHKHFEHARSDFMTLLHAVNGWRRVPDEERSSYCTRNYLNPQSLEEIELAAAEIKDILRGYDIRTEDSAKLDAIGKAITTGLIGNLISHDEGRTFMTDKVKGIRFFPGSALRDRTDVTYAVCAEIVETTRTYARDIQEVHPHWLRSVAPHLVPARKKKGKGRDKSKKEERQRVHEERQRNRGRRSRR